MQTCQLLKLPHQLQNSIEPLFCCVYAPAMANFTLMQSVVKVGSIVVPQSLGLQYPSCATVCIRIHFSKPHAATSAATRCCWTASVLRPPSAWTTCSLSPRPVQFKNPPCQCAVIAGHEALPDDHAWHGAACPASGGIRTIRSGDTLGNLATTCGTTTQCLQTANSISNPDQINLGQVLQVPASCATSSSPSPAASAPIPSSGSLFDSGFLGNFPDNRPAGGACNCVMPKLAVDGSLGKQPAQAWVSFQSLRQQALQLQCHLTSYNGSPLGLSEVDRKD